MKKALAAVAVAALTLLPGVAAAQEAAGISLDVTVAPTTDAGTAEDCAAASDDITVPLGTPITWCFTVSNDGAVALDAHSLTDSYGTVIEDEAVTVAPGTTYTVVRNATAEETGQNVGTWTAIAGDQRLVAQDAAAVTIEGHVALPGPGSEEPVEEPEMSDPDPMPECTAPGSMDPDQPVSSDEELPPEDGGMPECPYFDGGPGTPEGGEEPIQYGPDGAPYETGPISAPAGGETDVDAVAEDDELPRTGAGAWLVLAAGVATVIGGGFVLKRAA